MGRPITKGSTDQSAYILVMNRTDGVPTLSAAYNDAGALGWYMRDQSAAVTFSLATLASAAAAHKDGGFIHGYGGNYRLDIPDAALAAGVDHVEVSAVFDAYVCGIEKIDLLDVDPYDSQAFGLSILDNLSSSLAAMNDLSTTDIKAMNVDDDGTAIDLEGAFKLMLSVLTGKSSGGGTPTLSFRDLGDTKDRIEAVVTSYGDRSSVTRDAT